MNGPMFIYNGLETKSDHVQDLFNKDVMSWEYDEEWFNFIKKLIEYKKNPVNLKLNTTKTLLTKGANLAFKNTYSD